MRLSVSASPKKALSVEPFAVGAPGRYASSEAIVGPRITESKKASSPPSHVGAMPVNAKSPMSRHRSNVATVHSPGAVSLTEMAAQPVVLGPAT